MDKEKAPKPEGCCFTDLGTLQFGDSAELQSFFFFFLSVLTSLSKRATLVNQPENTDYIQVCQQILTS